MQVIPLSESSYILRDFEVDAYLLARSIETACIPGIEEVVPSVNTVGIFVDPDRFQLRSINVVRIIESMKGAHWRVPILFDGSDLNEICKNLVMSADEVCALFCSATYTVMSIGFLPGFPYLKGLPREFMQLTRRSVPRIHVPKGSIGIAAGQAGIYPKESPGGWQLIATTPLTIADPDKPYFPINPGDTIRFYEVGQEQYKSLKNRRLGDNG
jgi:inhibitor of KinA